MNDVERLLTILKTSESAFIDHLFAFMVNGLLDKEQFRDVIIAARAAAFEDGVEAQADYAHKVNIARRARSNGRPVDIN